MSGLGAGHPCLLLSAQVHFSSVLVRFWSVPPRGYVTVHACRDFLEKLVHSYLVCSRPFSSVSELLQIYTLFEGSSAYRPILSDLVRSRPFSSIRARFGCTPTFPSISSKKENHEAGFGLFFLKKRVFGTFFRANAPRTSPPRSTPTFWKHPIRGKHFQNAGFGNPRPILVSSHLHLFVESTLYIETGVGGLGWR